MIGLIHIDDYVLRDDWLGFEIKTILGFDNFNVEVFGLDSYLDKKLPKNCDIIDYLSRETLALIRDGEIITDKNEIEEIERKEYFED